MTKTLQSGIQVDETKYLQLLQWKENNICEFNLWRIKNYIHTISITSFTSEQYQSLLKFAGI